MVGFCGAWGIEPQRKNHCPVCLSTPSARLFRAVTLDFLLSGDILVFTDKVKEHDKLAA